MKAKLHLFTISVSLLVVQHAWSDELPHSIKIFIAAPLESKPDPSFLGSTTKIEIFDLSLKKRIEATLSHSLSDNPEVARNQAKSMIESNLKSLKSSLRTAIQAHLLADHFKLSQLPAAVINDSIIVYGTTDISEIFLVWKKSNSEW